jgi:glutathione S-transferase
MRDALAVLEAAVAPGPFLLGREMSVADIYIAMLFTWFAGEIDAPYLTALTDGVKQHPVISPIWRRHFGDR